MCPTIMPGIAATNPKNSDNTPQNNAAIDIRTLGKPILTGIDIRHSLLAGLTLGPSKVLSSTNLPPGDGCLLEYVNSKTKQYKLIHRQA